MIPRARAKLVLELSKLVTSLDNIPGVGFSKATKVLHTRYPEIIPMIDNPLQKEYGELRPEWKKGDWYQLLKDYYNNLLEKETSNNLQDLRTRLSHLNLTKVRIFDILWWSFLKSKNPKNKGIKWKTIWSAS